MLRDQCGTATELGNTTGKYVEVALLQRAEVVTVVAPLRKTEEGRSPS